MTPRSPTKGRRATGPWRSRSSPPLVADVAGSGPAVVLLHGQPGSASDWAAVARLLSGRHTVVVPDRSGYGRTGGLASGFGANAGQVVRLLDRLQVGSATVVGHSWGGGVALAMARLFPERVGGLVLVSSVSPLEPVGLLDRLLARPVVGKAVVVVTLSTAGRLLSWGPGRAFAGRRLRGQPRQQIEELARSWRKHATWHSFAIEQRALVTELPSMAAGLDELGAPVLVVTGTADRVVPAPTARHLADAIPGARLETVEGAGHLLPQLYPETVAELVHRASGPREV